MSLKTASNAWSSSHSPLLLIKSFELRNFYDYVNEKNINYESRIQLHKLKRLCKTENPDKNYINNASIDLYNDIMNSVVLKKLIASSK